MMLKIMFAWVALLAIVAHHTSGVEAAGIRSRLQKHKLSQQMLATTRTGPGKNTGVTAYHTKIGEALLTAQGNECGFPNGHPKDFGSYHEMYSAVLTLGKLSDENFAKTTGVEAGLWLIAGTLAGDYAGPEKKNAFCRMLNLWTGMKAIQGFQDLTGPVLNVAKARIGKLEDDAKFSVEYFKQGFAEKKMLGSLSTDQWIAAGFVGDFGYNSMPNAICFGTDVALEFMYYGGCAEASKGFVAGATNEMNLEQQWPLFWKSQPNFVGFVGTASVDKAQPTGEIVAAAGFSKDILKETLADVAAMQECTWADFKAKDADKCAPIVKKCQLVSGAYVPNDSPIIATLAEQEDVLVDSQAFPYHATLIHGTNFVEAVTKMILNNGGDPKNDEVALKFGQKHDSGYSLATTHFGYAVPKTSIFGALTKGEHTHGLTPYTADAPAGV